MIWITVIIWSCFCSLYRAFPSSTAKNVINLISIDSLVMFICRVIFCAVGRECLLWPVSSLGKILVSLCPASFCTPRSNFPVIPGIFWLPTFAFQSPMMKRTSFLGVRSRRSCRSSWDHSTSASLTLVVGHRLGLLWYWMVCIGNEQRSFCSFWDCTQVLHFGLFRWLWWLLHFL